MNKQDSTSKRSGETVITSVSVSKQFQQLLAEYNLSPTEAFRRGVAVSLCDLGVGMYQSQKNEDRLKYVQEFMKKMEEDEKLSEQFAKIELFEKAQKQLNELAENMEKQWDAIIYTRRQQIQHIKENQRQENEEKLRAMGLYRVEPRLTPDNIIKGLL